ncbi:MAG: alpha-glucosidase C-terminal domain-containing protein, partial [bacterium]
IALEDRHPIVEIMQQTPDIPETCQWAVFLRNHDELTLEMVTSKERDYMYRMYAADARAKINLGIRRRLAPLMENDMDRIKLMNSLLLSMPGSPIIYYGDEIGMGDNIFLGDRNGVRTPMQWSPDRNAGFSRADPQRLYLPAIQDPIYGYEAVNVEAQARDPSSLLNWMRRMLAVRKTSRAFGRGKLTFLRAGNRKILAYLRELGDEAILCVANLGRSAQPVELDLKRYRGRVPVELLGRTPFPPIGELPYLLTLPAHGFYWFRLAADVEVPHWHEEFLVRDEAPVLVLFDGWMSLFPERVVPWRIGLAEKARRQFETEIVPRFVEAQRWYAAKGEAVARATLVEHG